MKATIDLAPYPSPPVELVSAYWARRRSKQITPHPPLHAPIHHPSDPPHINLFHRVSSFVNTRQEENHLLNLRGQVSQPHDVRHACRGDLALDFDAARLSSNPNRSPTHRKQHSRRNSQSNKEVALNLRKRASSRRVALGVFHKVTA